MLHAVSAKYQNWYSGTPLNRNPSTVDTLIFSARLSTIAAGVKKKKN